MKLSSILSAIGLALLLTPAPALAGTSSLDLNLPDFGDSAGAIISPEMERRIGQAFLRHVRQHARIVDDPEVQAYIESLGYRLASNSDGYNQPFTFFMVDDAAINAFAAPGGVIGMNTGVILKSRNESEVAGVMAHEIAHITQRHLARMFERQQQLAMPMLAAMIGSILLAVANPAAGQAAMTAVAAGQAQHGINFTRSNEQEADRIGMQILARSNFDPHGMADFFERLHQASRIHGGGAPEYLQTHPLTTNRIAEARSRAEQYVVTEVHGTESYEFIRAKLMVRNESNPVNAVTMFRERLKESNPENEQANRYGYAIALTDAGNYAEARQQIDKLLEQDGERATVLLASAKLEVSQSNYGRAIEIYRHIAHLYPDYRPMVLGLAKTLLAAGQPAEARTLLRRYGRNNVVDHHYFDLLSQAEGQAGDEIEAGIARAAYFYELGDTQIAIERLKHAQRQPGMDYYQQQRISARLDRYTEELQLERELRL